MTEDDLKAIEAEIDARGWILGSDARALTAALRGAREENERLRSLCMEQRLQGIRDGIEIEALEHD